MADERNLLEDDPFLTAGEFALGVLEGSELTDARRMVLSDRRFAEAVEWWETRLSAMSEGASELLPSNTIWQAIELRLADRGAASGAVDNLKPRGSGPAGWSIATALAGLAAAAAALVLFLNTPSSIETPLPPVAQAPTDQLIAQLQDEESGRRLAGTIDPRSARLALNIAGLEAEAGKAPELWVIPAGSSPVSLGAIPQSGRFSRELSRQENALLAEGATLAVTFEDDTGERHETPTMPIILAGTLDRV